MYNLYIFISLIIYLINYYNIDSFTKENLLIYNVKKHKTNKISLITDVNGIPINIKTMNINILDVKILSNQFDNLKKENPLLFY